MTVGWKPETLSEIAGQDEIRIGSGRMGGGCNTRPSSMDVRSQTRCHFAKH
jgi:hypothetical protein